MKKTLLLICILTFSLVSNAQCSDLEGVFISEDNKDTIVVKTDCVEINITQNLTAYNNISITSIEEKTTQDNRKISILSFQLDGLFTQVIIYLDDKNKVTLIDTLWTDEYGDILETATNYKRI
jgi:hypothetical protein